MTQMPYEQPPVQQPYPTAPGVTGPKSAWLIVIGVISIVFGGLGVICTPFSLLIQNIPNSHTNTPVARMPELFPGYSIITIFFAVGLAVLLLVAGIKLLRRQSVACGLYMTYAILALAIALINGLASFVAMGNVDLPPEIAIGMRAGLAIGVCMGPIFPIFLLIWFSRENIRREMQSWKTH